MAGIGFELKKMFEKKGAFALVKAYGYAGVVCAGPMLLGIFMLLSIRILAGFGGADEMEKQLLNSMITDTLLFSLVITNLFSLMITRYIADQLFCQEKKKVLASFWGCSSILVVAGDLLFTIFLFFSGICLEYKVMCFILLGELILVWCEISYLTAIKDYSGIVKIFLIAVLSVICCGYGLILLGGEPVFALLMSVCTGYGLMAAGYYILLAKYFAEAKKEHFEFLKWVDQYPQLLWIGLFLSIGLFGHLIIMRFSPYGECIQGLFYTVAVYEVPALFAFLSILVTTVNFVTSVEVNFYPKYRTFFSLFNDGGTLNDILQAGHEMKIVLYQELVYTFSKQLFATIIFILSGTIILPKLPLGMTDEMLGIYRILCVAYAFYAIGNCIMLMQLYFVDLKGAFISAFCFMLVSSIGTIISIHFSVTTYGLGFFCGSVVFTGISLLQLYVYLRKIIFHVLCSQPLTENCINGPGTKLASFLEQRMTAKEVR